MEAGSERGRLLFYPTRIGLLGNILTYRYYNRTRTEFFKDYSNTLQSTNVYFGSILLNF